MNKFELKDFLDKNVEDLNNYEIDIFDEVLSRIHRDEYVELEEIVVAFVDALDYNIKIKLLKEYEGLFGRYSYYNFWKPDSIKSLIDSIDIYTTDVFLYNIKKERVIKNVAYYKISNFIETKKDVFIDTEIFENFWDSLDFWSIRDEYDCDDEISKIEEFIKKIEVML